MVECLAHRQIATGHSVRVVTLDRIFHGDGRRLPAREMLGGVEVCRVPFFLSTRYPVAPGVLRHVRDADIVHVHAIDFLFDYLALTKPLHRRSLIVSTHGGFFHTEFARIFKNVFFHTATRLSLSQYGYVAASGEADGKLFRKLRRNGIGVIENGVDVGKFRDAASPIASQTVLAFGRLAPHKNVPALIPYLRRLREIGGDWKLVVAGTEWGVSLAELRSAAAAEGIADAVETIASPSDAELRALIARSSVFASASSYEGFGIAVVEALSAGLLPALSDIPPHRRICNAAGVGVLLDFQDPERAAARTLEAWGEWTTDLPACRAKSVAAAQRYEWEGVAQRFEKIYRVVAGSGRRHILGTDVHVMGSRALVAEVDRAVESRMPFRLAFLNANLALHAKRDPDIARALGQCFVVNDGLGVDLASRLLYGRRFPENLNGTDFTPLYLEKTRHSLRLFLLGAAPGVAEKAADVILRKWPRHRVVGVQHGYFGDEEEGAVLEQIRAAAPDIVLVGIGNPRQERWMARNCPEVCPCAFGIGALFDFMSGRVPRARAWMRVARCEWLFRLSLEPRRLWRRYLVGNIVFLASVSWQYVKGERA